MVNFDKLNVNFLQNAVGYKNFSLRILSLQKNFYRHFNFQGWTHKAAAAIFISFVLATKYLVKLSINYLPEMNVFETILED